MIIFPTNLVKVKNTYVSNRLLSFKTKTVLKKNISFIIMKSCMIGIEFLTMNILYLHTYIYIYMQMYILPKKSVYVYEGLRE